MPIVQQGKGDVAKGLPTANIKLKCEKGVYLCETNYGHGIAFCIKENKVEIHLIGFNRNIYGKNLEVTEMKPLNKRRLLEIAVLINT